MKEKDIGLKKKKLNTESFFKSLETNSKIRRILYLIKCLESCPTLLKPEIIINVEVIIKKWRDKDLRSTAFQIQSEANIILVNTSYFMKNTQNILKL